VTVSLPDNWNPAAAAAEMAQAAQYAQQMAAYNTR
jgi:hypothetical protein